MSSETQVLPEPPLSFESFFADLVVVPIEELPSDERACHICTEPYWKSTIGFTAINVSSEVPVRLACGHVFVKDCIANWLTRGTTCPFCRRQVFEPCNPPRAQWTRRMSYRHSPSPGDRAHSVASSLDEASEEDPEATEASLNLAARGTTVQRLVQLLPLRRGPEHTTVLRVIARLERRGLEGVAARPHNRNNLRYIEPSTTGQDAERAVPGPRIRISSLIRDSHDDLGVAETQTAAVPRPRETWSTERVRAAERMIQMIAAHQQGIAESRPIERPREVHESGPMQGIAAARSASRAVAPPRRPRTFGDIASMRASTTVAAVAAQNNQIVPVVTPRTRTSVALLGRSRRVMRDRESHNVSTRASSRMVSSRGPAANPRIVGRPLTRSISRGNDLNLGF